MASSSNNEESQPPAAPPSDLASSASPSTSQLTTRRVDSLTAPLTSFTRLTDLPTELQSAIWKAELASALKKRIVPADERDPWGLAHQSVPEAATSILRRVGQACSEARTAALRIVRQNPGLARSYPRQGCVKEVCPKHDVFHLLRNFMEGCRRSLSNLGTGLHQSFTDANRWSLDPADRPAHVMIGLNCMISYSREATSHWTGRKAHDFLAPFAIQQQVASVTIQRMTIFLFSRADDLAGGFGYDDLEHITFDPSTEETDARILQLAVSHVQSRKIGEAIDLWREIWEDATTRAPRIELPVVEFARRFLH